MPFGIGALELSIILVIVLGVCGAGRVPEIGRALGKGIKEFRSSVDSNAETTASTSQESTSSKTTRPMTGKRSKS